MKEKELKGAEILPMDISLIEPNEGQVPGVPANPRIVSKKDFKKLCKSIEETPEMLSHRQLIVYPLDDGKYMAVDGNQRLRALNALGYTTAFVSVLKKDTPVEVIKAIAIKDNTHAGSWDMDLLANEWDAEDLENWGVNVWQTDEEEEPDKPTDSDGEQTGDDDLDMGPDKPFIPIEDVLFPSDNDFEIPALRADLQGGRVQLPITPWGANSRLRKDVNTYHFYVDDYRFEALWKDPSILINSGVKAIVEPNCSCHDQTPIAYGLQLIYKKRWLARYCQEYGIKVYVDLNVSHKFIEYNKLGVPKGYNAFFTRGLIGWMDSLESDLKVAQEISGLETPNLIVYGGGKEIEKFCQEHGLLYITDFVNAKKKD